MRHSDLPATQESSTPPLDVEILTSKRMGSLLTVKVQIRPKTDLMTSEVAVTLLGLKEGEVVAEQTVGLDEVTDESEVDAGEAIPILLTLNGDNFSEYQVRTSWGEDRKRFASGSGAKQASSEEQTAAAPTPKPKSEPKPQEALQSILSAKLEKVEKEELSCSKPPCDFKFIVTLKLTNSSARNSVGSIGVAVGLFWAEEGQEPMFPAPWGDLKPNEEPLALEGITLAPGESRNVRLKLDTEVPVVPGGAFRATARLLSAELL